MEEKQGGNELKEIKLNQLVLKNFKGIKDFTLDLNGENAKIYGQNASGKSSLYDAFLFLLFGKDSQNKSDFAIKTLVNGVALSNLDHEVEAHFSVDGEPLTLRKVYKEKWVTKTGEINKEMRGHETDHYVNSVPVKAKEYKEAVDKLVNEDVFKLLTSPTYFNEQMKWQDRRSTLLEVVGDIDINDVLNFNSELKGLPTILKGRAVEDHKKITASRMSEIKKEIDMIPVQIKENQRTIDSVDAIDVAAINKELATIERTIDANGTIINNIESGTAIITKQNELRQVEMDLKDIQTELEAESTAEGHKLTAKIQEEKSNIAILERKKDGAEYQVERNTGEIRTIDGRLQELKAEWYVINESGFVHEAEGNCPTCKQSLPVEDVSAAHEKALSEFNLMKSKDLERVDVAGKKDVTIKKALIEENKKLITTKDDTQSQMDKKEKVISKLTEEVEALRTTIKAARQNPKYMDKLKEKEAIASEFKELQENAQESILSVKNETVDLRIKRDQLNAEKAQADTAKASGTRIAELESQQKELAVEHERLGKEMHLADQFVQSKVKLLEERINSKFTHARFKMFEILLNGSTTEMCETLSGGVPYSRGLNNAAKINIGLEICQTLQEHYGVKLPIFVDNRESIVNLFEIDTQLISLIVSEPDKKLRVELDE